MTLESKSKLFGRILGEREALSQDDAEKASLEIENKILHMEEFRVALRIGLYAAFKNEVRTDHLFVEGCRMRKEFYYPAVDTEGKGLAYFRVSMLDELKPTDVGMREPSLKKTRLRDINTLKVLIVPGVVFDLTGGRMGYGKGFYDDCLEKFRGTRIALAYDFQVIDELPQGSRGYRVDWIITEKRMIRCHG